MRLLHCLFAGLATWVSLSLLVSAQAQDQTPNRDAQQKFTSDLQKQLRNGRRLAIVIGIDGYAKDPLRCCVNDAKLLAATLKDRCGYDPDLILEMTDKQPNPSLRPTLVNLRHQLRQFLSNASPKDTVLVSFSGHGGVKTEKNGTSVRRRGFVCPLDFEGSRVNDTSLPIDELRELLQSCAAAQKLLILDSCHSGGADATAGLTIENGVDQSFQKAQGLITLAACRREEISSEDREVGHGAFTMSLVQGLEGRADFDQNKVVDSDEIYRHVISEVPAHVHSLFPGRNQTPVRVIGQDVVGVFALAPVMSRPKAMAALARMKPGDTLKNSIGMPLVLLPRSSYIKGSPRSEYKRREDEAFRAVVLQKRILLGVHEVTQAEYQAVMGHNPSYFSAEGNGAADIGELKTGRFPVEQVSWNDAVTFCERLSALPSEASANRVYRLPTESEWEYACRAGSIEAFSTGQVIDGSQANIRSNEPYWYASGSPALGRTQTVERFAPNLFGLHDMHGNVAEWCQDNFSEQPSGMQIFGTGNSIDENNSMAMLEQVHELLSAPVTAQFSAIDKIHMWEKAMDPQGPRTGSQRVIRGGSYLSDVAQCRSAARRAQSPEYTHKTIGFRVVCEQSNAGR